MSYKGTDVKAHLVNMFELGSSKKKQRLTTLLRSGLITSCEGVYKLTALGQGLRIFLSVFLWLSGGNRKKPGGKVS